MRPTSLAPSHDDTAACSPGPSLMVLCTSSATPTALDQVGTVRSLPHYKNLVTSRSSLTAYRQYGVVRKACSGGLDYPKQPSSSSVWIVQVAPAHTQLHPPGRLRRAVRLLAAARLPTTEKSQSLANVMVRPTHRVAIAPSLIETAWASSSLRLRSDGNAQGGCLLSDNPQRFS